MTDLSRLEQAIKNADAAGDTAAAQTLAAEYRRQMLGGPPAVEAPPETAQSQATVPIGVRAAVGNAPNDLGRLATLQQFYPGAKVTPTEGGNFQIEDPRQGTLTYNPTGLDIGDIASLGPEFAQTVGGAIGAGMGAPGGIPGAMAGAGLGAAAANELNLRLAQHTLGTVDPRTLPQQLGDIGVTGAMNALGQGTGEALGAAATGATRMIFRGGEQGRRQLAQAAADAQQWLPPGTPGVSVGEATGGLSNIIEGIFPPVTKMQRQAAAKAIGDGVKALGEKVGGGQDLSSAGAGRAIQAGIEQYGKTMRQKGDALNQIFYDHMPNTPIPMSNTIAAIQDALPHYTSMPGTTQAELASPLGRQMQTTLGDINNGNGSLYFDDAKAIRSRIGRQIKNPSLVPDIPTAQLKGLYGALSDDMRAAAEQRGPAAIEAFDNAQTYWHTHLRELEDVIQPIVNKEVPSKAMLALKGTLKNSPEYIDSIMKALTPMQRDAVRGSIIENLGYGPSKEGLGQTWSFQKYLNDWNSFDAKAKNKLFPDREYTGALDSLARLSGAMNRKMPGMLPAYTVAGAVGSAVLGGGGWFILPAGFALTALGASAGQRLITRNRAFVNWLAQTTKGKASGVSAAIGRLAGMAATADPQSRQDIKDFLGQLQEMGTGGQSAQ